MPVVKGGVWTNIEDEILKASVSKYGLNQWARVSSLLARKTPKQCKARWHEWLDPSIRKIEWSKEEDEKLLHLAKLMPTQWRTIAPIVGRTATQCLERYQKLLDEAEARENDEFSLGGPTGGETAAPSADDVRKLRPGEMDPDPESKPARPDTIDMDEDEKEMLSEARARLANTQGKKAKRKARERQLEESRRLAQLQKRRELKNAGINIKIGTRKAKQMDYNADIPFEKPAAPGFHDTQEEEEQNEKEREDYDPRKQQLANKRKLEGDAENEDRKRKKNDKGGQSSAAAVAAAKAGQMQKVREAERSSKRRLLNLPAPQVGDAELEDIVKMGLSGERATRAAGGSDNDATRGLVGAYGGVVGGTPIRTPRAPQEEDRIANEIRNARARTETQSALLGGENVPLYEGEGTTGYSSITPASKPSATPNPMALQNLQNGVGMTPRRPGIGPGATPMRTPRDNFRLNDETPAATSLAGMTPREVKMEQAAMRNSLKGKIAGLPKPKETDWELELPEMMSIPGQDGGASAEDSAVRDERLKQERLLAERDYFAKQSQVIRRSLPRPTTIDKAALLKNANATEDHAERMIAVEAVMLIISDAANFGADKSFATRVSDPALYEQSALSAARREIATSLNSNESQANGLEAAWASLHESTLLLGLDGYAEDEVDGSRAFANAFDDIQSRLSTIAASCSATEKKLGLHLGGYSSRSKTLRQKINAAGQALEGTARLFETKRLAAVGEEASIAERLDRLRTEVAIVMRRERQAQELYRERKSELET